MNNTTEDHIFLIDGLDSLEMTFFVLQCSLLPLSIFGNVLIIVCLCKYDWLRTPINYLICNLAVTDLLVCLASSPLGIFGTYMGMNKFRYLCLFDLATFCMLLLVSVTNMLAISVDRYFSVTFPFKHKARAMKHVKRFIPSAWITIILYSSFPLGWNNFSDEVGICKHHVVWPYLYQVFTTVYIVIAVIFNIIFFSFVVRIALQKLPSDNADRHIQRRIRKTYVMIVISALFIVCWTPYCIVTLHRMFATHHNLKVVQGWTFVLVIVNSSLNWMVYGLKTAKFRKAFKMLLCRGRLVERVDSNSSSYT